MTRALARALSASPGSGTFGTILADPPWRFANRTGKAAPEHRRLACYETLSFEEIGALPVADHAADPAHCYVRGRNARTRAPGRRQVNLLASRKREHSRKPDEQYDVIERCSWGPSLELFGRGRRDGWTVWGNQAEAAYRPSWLTYPYNATTIEAMPDRPGVCP